MTFSQIYNMLIGEVIFAYLSEKKKTYLVNKSG